jgi:hypothetical protein
MMLGVLSVDPSSTTITSISAGSTSCSSTLTIACSMKRSWLYVSIKTLTKGRGFVIEGEAPGHQNPDGGCPPANASAWTILSWRHP